jgi:hypothetical protein
MISWREVLLGIRNKVKINNVPYAMTRLTKVTRLLLYLVAIIFMGIA